MVVAADTSGSSRASRSTTTSPRSPLQARLPQPLTRFVGRAAAIAEVAEHLATHQLVTLTGPGGCGKTRMALELARRPAGLGEPVFVDLAPLQSAALVVSALGAAVGVPEGGVLPLAEVLHHALAERELLVVLDNCEHVVDECARLLSGLLTRCPGVRVLATSREALLVDGELTWRVPPLTLPPVDAADQPDVLAVLAASESGQLFLDRAWLAQPGYRLTSADAAAAVAVCRRLDGLPLALELAASRLRMLDVGGLAAALDDRFGVLDEAGPRSAPARQRTLEASVDWSYGLLSEPEKQLFRRLGVFAGAFDGAAAAAVGDDPPMLTSNTLSVLGRLVDQSMLQVEREPGGVRYRLLETMRHFARLRLADASEADATRDRHLAHHLGVADRFRVAVDAPTEADRTVEAATLVLDDLREALDWSLASGQAVAGLRIATSLRWLWVAGGRIQEGRRRLAELLAADDGQDQGVRAAALAAGGMLALLSADPASQRALATEALELGRSVGDPAVQGEALIALGWASTFLDPPTAYGRLVEGLLLLDGTGLDRFVEYGEIGLGVALANEGRLPEATDALVAAVERAAPARSWAAQLALGTLGYVEALQGRLSSAGAHHRDALSGTYSDMFQNQVRQWYGLTLTYQGDYDGAAAVFGAADVSARGFGVPLIPGWLHFALFELARGRTEEATALASRVLPFFQVMGWRWFETQAHRVLGDAAALDGDPDRATEHWHAAMTAAKAADNPLATTVAHVGLARDAGGRGDVARARSLLRTAVRAAVGADYQIGALDALDQLAILAATAPDPALAPREAVHLAAAADAVRASIGYARPPAEQAALDTALDTALAAVTDVSAHAGGGTDHVLDLAAARREGAALSLEEAAALACRGESRPLRPPSGWASLTPAEQRVVDLVAEGLTNPEIGERLFISRRTVQTHLSRVFTKLGVTNRAELAAAVSRRRSNGA